MLLHPHMTTIGNRFGRLKDNGGIVTRHRKTDTRFSAFIPIAATMLWPG